MRVLLADDHEEVRSALRLILEQEAGVSVVGEAAEAGELLRQARSADPDLVLMDWELPGLPANGSRGGSARLLLSALRALCPRVVVLALSGQPEARRAALAAGVDGFVSKADPPEYLLAALRGVGVGSGS